MVKQLIVKIISLLGLRAGGPIAWVVSLILEWLFNWAKENGIKLIQKWWDKGQNKKKKEQDIKDQQKYENTINNPTTNEELEDATTDILNGNNK